MKNLLLLFCLLATACNTTPPLSPTQQAVTAYLKKTLDDPTSYQPVRWGKPAPFQQQEVDHADGDSERIPSDGAIERAKIGQESYMKLVDLGAGPAVLAGNQARTKQTLHEADSLSKVIARLHASTDTTRLGMSIWHTFRTKNKMGALVLDSARFIVKKNGEVIAAAQ